MRMMPVLRAGVALSMLICVLAACSKMNAYSNKPLPKNGPEAGPIAPSDGRLQPIWKNNPGCFQRAPGWEDNVLALTLSGGGSRAAVFGAAVMFELQDIGALDAVDFVSSVSGGSLAAALYALSRDAEGVEVKADPGERGLIIWDRDEVLELASRDLLRSWIFRWIRPDSIVKYWFTAYDRTDLFADTLDAQMFNGLGRDDGSPTFADLNPQRAILILNATNFTEGRPTDVFTFTPGDFKKVLSSDICTYNIGAAVAASAAFPGVFHYATVGNFTQEDRGDPMAPTSYVHLMDGGATDNLGLKGLDRAMEQLNLCGEGTGGRPDPCRKRLVLVADAQNGFEGRERSTPDPRRLVDRIVDTNFLDAYSTLMQGGYGQLLRNFRGDVEDHPSGLADGAGVLHLSLLTLIRDGWLGYDGQYGESTACPEDRSARSTGTPLGGTEDFAMERACALQAMARNSVADGDWSILQRKLRRINTDWRIEPDEVACLEVAAYALVAGARPELQKFFGDKQLKPQVAARFDRNKRECLGQAASAS